MGHAVPGLRQEGAGLRPRTVNGELDNRHLTRGHADKTFKVSECFMFVNFSDDEFVSDFL